MKIAIAPAYGTAYLEDRLFDNASCSIGENLLMPNIALKEALERQGHEVHTIDRYQASEIDVALFMDVPDDSLLTIDSFKDAAKYILRGNWKHDYFLRTVLKRPKKGCLLQINEPPVVSEVSYRKKYHGLFDKVLTYRDDLVDHQKYEKYWTPQYVPADVPSVPFSEKKLLTMIVGNKTSTHPLELYSERRRAVDFFEDKPGVFDLYGFGWEKENLRNYRGTVEKKLETLANYRFCICYENMKETEGYITEKIFDCFFARTVPIYWGAPNITDVIPADTYIDMTRFASVEEMYRFLKEMNEDEIAGYLERARAYIRSEQFKKTFSVDAYISRFLNSFAEIT